MLIMDSWIGSVRHLGRLLAVPLLPLAMLQLACPSALNRAVAADSRIAPIGGVPTLIVNSRPHSGMCYSTYDTSSPNLERRAAQFAAAGCDIFNFVVEISGYGYSRPLWRARDQWDFTDLDDRAHRILAAAPGAYLWPRIYIDAPGWWRAEHPQELMILGNGSTSFGDKLFALPRAGDYPSLASGIWRRDMQVALRTIVEHMEQSDYADRIVGYQLSGQKTEEWYHWSMNCPLLGDYSPHMQLAFRSWLTEKYGLDQALQNAWQQPDVTLATVTIPSQEERIGDRSRTFRQIPREQPVVDFHRFWSEIMADTVELFARTVKQSVRQSKVVGAFYAYTFEFAELGEDAGHLALHRLLRSPDVDFIMAPSSYYNRNLPGTPYFRAPITSLTLHNKLFWNDFDQVSYRYFDKLKADPNLKTWEYQMGLTRTAEEFVWMNCREIGMTLTSGVQTAHFDIHGGYYEDEVIMAGVQQLGQLRRESLQRPDRTSLAEILLLVDEDSPHYLRFRSPADQPGTLLTNLLSGQIAEMDMVAPYDTALLSDLAQLDTRRYKLVLVLNAFRLDSQQRAVLNRKIACDDRTVIWFYAPGIFSDTGSADPANMAQITGIQIAPCAASSATSRAVALVEPASEPWDAPLLDGDAMIVEDPKTEAIASRTDDRQRIVVARRRLDHWTSIYTAAAPLPARYLKQVARDAGVHLYHDDCSQLLFANRNYVTLGADADGGETTIRLPQPSTVVDTMTGEVIGRQISSFAVSLRPKEVRLFALTRVDE